MACVFGGVFLPLLFQREFYVVQPEDRLDFYHKLESDLTLLSVNPVPVICRP